jgi:hypothetical protein
MMTPIVQTKKQNKSSLVDLSPISMKEIRDVIKGLLMMRTVFDTGMKSMEKIYYMKPKQEPRTLIAAY